MAAIVICCWSKLPFLSRKNICFAIFHPTDIILFYGTSLQRVQVGHKVTIWEFHSPNLSSCSFEADTANSKEDRITIKHLYFYKHFRAQVLSLESRCVHNIPAISTHHHRRVLPSWEFLVGTITSLDQLDWHWSSQCQWQRNKSWEGKSLTLHCMSITPLHVSTYHPNANYIGINLQM